MKRILLLVLVFVVGIVMLYLSRFWFLDLWPRSGLFGWEALRPGGGLLGRWLRGTPFAPFELLIWAIGIFLILTYLQRFIDFILAKTTSQEDDANDH
ncbi:hypothetical protein C1J03_11965 [Sulfitobacter sp. SK012]|uniref:hypothetical protein n=1 Tax=Sulfitobacter sp. SK012 TaxID=1389005 RepID=UPI000E0A885A|nr:hypothetical protein [Sulfitobacter sp. SK012]AXI46673.1 hypothetical protein C1J03_11965 [Sulfitobacter sp. SK012]